MNTLSLKQFDQHITQLLHIPELEPHVDKDSLYNGLQSYGSNTIRTVGFGVSASLSLFELAKKEKCDAVIVHHGLPIPEKHLDRFTYERLAFLIQNNISLWSAHYLLDAHPVLGNNAQLLQLLNARIVAPYTEKDGSFWGYIGETIDTPTLDSLISLLTPHLSPRTIVYPFGNQTVRKIVAVYGKGAPRTLQEMEKLQQNDVDLFITGEIHEWNREFFREAGISCIAGGHYHTEMLGLKALQHHVDNKLGLRTVWLDAENDV